MADNLVIALIWQEWVLVQLIVIDVVSLACGSRVISLTEA